jgi:hypothetical protein
MTEWVVCRGDLPALVMCFERWRWYLGICPAGGGGGEVTCPTWVGEGGSLGEIVIWGGGSNLLYLGKGGGCKRKFALLGLQGKICTIGGGGGVSCPACGGGGEGRKGKIRSSPTGEGQVSSSQRSVLQGRGYLRGMLGRTFISGNINYNL